MSSSYQPEATKCHKAQRFDVWKNNDQLFFELYEIRNTLSCKSTEFVMAQQLAHTVTCVVYRIKDNFSNFRFM